jgi:hypothetical protein
MEAAKVRYSAVLNQHDEAERGPFHHIVATCSMPAQQMHEWPHSNMQKLDLDTTQFIAAVCPFKPQPPAAALLAPDTAASSSSVMLPRTGILRSTSTGCLPLNLLMNMQRLVGITE